MFSRTLLFALLIFLPGITLAAAAVWFGIRGTLKLGLILLAGIAVPGYLVFWLYLASHRAGLVVSAVLPYLLGALLALLLIRFQPQQRRRLLPLLRPIGLTYFAALGVLSLGFLYGGKEAPFETAQNRFSHPLPPDDMMPFVFAEQMRYGLLKKPMFGDWLSSDRPPLQTEIILSLEPAIRSRALDYETASVLLQCLWVFSLWLLLRAFRISRLSRGLVIGTIYLTGFALVNSFYVWPKLLAAAYMLAFAIPVLALRPMRSLHKMAGRHKWWLRGVSAFLLACGMLGHGGSVFAAIGITLFMLARLRLSVMRESGLVVLLAGALYSPWIGYQKLVDPPGDRLLKWHLAGVEQPTSVAFLPTILHAYEVETFSNWRRAKESNFRAVFAYEGEFVKQLGFQPGLLKEMRGAQFFYLVPSIGFVSLGALGILVWRKSKELMAARCLLACCLLTAIPTILLLFEQSAATIQSTSYAMVLMAMAGCILAFRAALPRVAIVVCLAQSIWSWAVYAPDLRPWTIPGAKPVGMNGGLLAMHILSLAALTILMFSASKPKAI
jgi:hypothetical protein